MGLKAAVAEREVMGLGEGRERPGLAQGHYKYGGDGWGVPSAAGLQGMPTSIWEAST